MVEIAFTYDFQANIDEHAYNKIAKKATAMMKEADGFLEFRANRNLVGSPHVRRSSVWKSLAHWAALAQQPEFQAITHEFRTHVRNLEVNFWGPSPLLPEPIKASDE